MKDTNVGIKANVREKINTYSLFSNSSSPTSPFQGMYATCVWVWVCLTHTQVCDLKFEKLNNHFYKKKVIGSSTL